LTGLFEINLALQESISKGNKRTCENIILAINATRAGSVNKSLGKLKDVELISLCGIVEAVLLQDFLETIS
jgi:hypothetical protein